MRFSTKTQAILMSVAAMTCALGVMTGGPASASIPPPGGGTGGLQDCLPYNDSVTFSGSNVTFKAYTVCDEHGVIWIYGGKGTSPSGDNSHTCVAGDKCFVSLTIKTSGSGSYCVRSEMDIASGQVDSKGLLCKTK